MRGRNSRGVVYLPLEIVTREYAGKLLVAIELASRGFHAVIGHKGPVNKTAINAKSPGIYFYKSADLGIKTRPELYLAMMNKGFIFVAQDEEAGIAYQNFRDFYSHRSSLKYYGNLDAFFCWGLDDYEFLSERHPESRDKLYLTGAPRTFLWTPEGSVFYEETVNSIKTRYGQYYLFVSNFSGANSAKGEKENLRRLVLKHESSSHSLQLVHNIIEQDKRLIKQFVKAAIKVNQTSGLQVVIRPHPGEKWETWENMVKDYPGIHVETEHDLITWIRGAKAVIQNGCTTAIEARCAAEVPVFAYAENSRDIEDRPRGFPNLVTKKAIGLEELVHSLKNLASVWQSFLQYSPNSVLDRKVVRPPEGSPRVIADIITSLAENAGGLYSSDLPIRPGRFYSRLNRARKSLKKMILKMDTPSRISKNKRRPIKLQQVTLDVGRAVEALSLEGDAFFVRELYDNSFLIGLR